MSDIIDRARAYIAKCPSAVSGQAGHDATFTVASALVNGFALSQSEALSLLSEYNQRCVPPWSERELEHKIASAMSTTHDKPRGHLAGKSDFRAPERKQQSQPTRKAEPVRRKYEPDPSAQLPAALEDGCRQLISAAFEPGEGVGIAQESLNEEGHGIPCNAGPTLSREEWLRKLDSKGGDPNRIFSSAQNTGAFIRVNPMKIGGSKDADVTAFRHALLEFDRMSLSEQWSLLLQSRVPCTAVLHSGNKSLHAWVRVDAKDRADYAQRVKLLFEHFEGLGLDDKNKNPSRFSRLPGMVRGKGNQSLLALKVGTSSFTKWLVEQDLAGIGQRIAIDALRKFNPTTDPDCLLGNRWLGRGYSCIWQAQTGVGKSSLTMQAAMTWALGRSFLGIAPIRPMKSLIVQNENDLGDVAEVFQGVCNGLGVTVEENALLDINLVFYRQRGHAGLPFLNTLARLCEQHKPDFAWIDPLYCFFGADLSSQRDCSEFFTALGAILEASGVCVHFVHHTGKPPKDPKAGKLKGGARSYDGLGSSIIPNWMRAVISIEEAGDGLYKALFTKRGRRAAAKSTTGAISSEIWLQHAQTGIFWMQVAEPQKPEREQKRAGKPAAVFNKAGFIHSIQADGDGQQVAMRRGRLVEKVMEFAEVKERKANDFITEALADHYQAESKMYVF